MPNNTRLKFFGMTFVDELLLHSGQYALFYILMNFTMDRLAYFSNFGHSILLLILILQTVFLVKYGDRPLLRFLGSLIVPLIYTTLELREGSLEFFNIGHIFFWVFSILVGFLQAIELKVTMRKIKLSMAFAITNINVLIFIFLYFYFDLSLGYGKLLSNGEITDQQFRHYLSISFLSDGMVDFMKDPAHVYVILGGIILSLSLAIGRIRIIQLKDRINGLFGTYVDNDIRDRILSGNGRHSERKNLVILFSDIRGFTHISEHQPPHAITEMLNFYFSRWDQTVSRHQGVIDKFIGDAVMVLFGIQEPDKASERAVQCAIEMIDQLPEITRELRHRNLPIIEDIGIGINIGSVILGDIGSQKRKNFTVIGDSVNTASRLESLCKNRGTSLIISESTHQTLPASIRARFSLLGEARLKGKSDAVKVFGLKDR